MQLEFQIDWIKTEKIKLGVRWKKVVSRKTRLKFENKKSDT